MHYFFEDFEFDENRGSVLHRGERIHIRPKVLTLIALLIRRRDRVVLKRELKEVLWPGLAVGVTSLSTLLGETRALVGDSGKRQRVIRTEPGQGYRFVAPVELRSDDDDADLETDILDASPLAPGRRSSMMALDTVLGDLQRGRGRKFLVCGEAGSGKTRLATEISTLASARGFRVWRGHCGQSLEKTPLGPWIEILRTGLEEIGADRLPRLLGPDLLELVRCTPTSLSLLRAEGAAAAQARFRMMDSVCRFLRFAAEPVPCVVIVEDLQLADRVSLQLLDRLLATMIQSPLLFLGTLRPASLIAGGEKRISLLRKIHAAPATEIIELSPLAVSAIGKMLWPRAETRPHPEEVESAFRLTGGNIRLIVELKCFLTGPGKKLQIPELMPVRLGEATRWLLADLAPPCVTALRRAAVIGYRFNREILVSIGSESSPRVDELLNTGLEAGLIRRVSGERNEFIFVHELVAKFLRSSTSPLEMAHLHQRIAEEIERRVNADLPDRLTRLAHHWRGAESISGPLKAIEFALRAGEDEAGKGRHARASIHYREAIALMERAPEEDLNLRSRLPAGTPSPVV